jgi:hypothetical protein
MGAWSVVPSSGLASGPWTSSEIIVFVVEFVGPSICSRKNVRKKKKIFRVVNE